MMNPMTITTPAQEDRAFCQRMLPRVSRTFALSIEELPPELREAVRVAYLLCRVVDTVEDATAISRDSRAHLFDAFDEVLKADAFPPGPFEQLCDRTLTEVEPDDRELCRNVGSVLRVFRALPARQRAAIRPRVLEMSRGMRDYAFRSPLSGEPQIQDMKDLERYCYFVAGTVGLLLTELFLQHVPVEDESARTAIRENAVHFGLGLQMVNIAKDVATDLERGICFLPRDLIEAHGLSTRVLLDPRHRDAGLLVVRAVAERARDHLRRAQQYTELWPVPEGLAVRLFCAVPLGLALATLEEVEHSADTLVPGRVPALSREKVLRLFRDARCAVHDNTSLGQLLCWYELPAAAL